MLFTSTDSTGVCADVLAVAARKGLKNRLSRLWKGAAGETGPAQVGPAADSKRDMLADQSLSWHSPVSPCVGSMCWLPDQGSLMIPVYKWLQVQQRRH
jgi:hypothetical protein